MRYRAPLVVTSIAALAVIAGAGPASAASEAKNDLVTARTEGS